MPSICNVLCSFPSIEERGRKKRKQNRVREWIEERNGEGRERREKGWGGKRKKWGREGERGREEAHLTGRHGLYFQSTAKVLVLKAWSSASLE